MNGGQIGIIVNPASGKDIRRLVAKASVFDNQEKCAIIRRAIAGARATGINDFHFVPDTHDIASAAFAELGGRVRAQATTSPMTGTVLDTRHGAEELRKIGCKVVITLGGDGTNRAVVSGWRDAPLIPVSTGTNNAFPVMVEATVAGAAAGLIASGAVALELVAERAKIVAIEIDNEDDDLALIDAVVTSDRFIGARALLDSDRLIMAVLTRASSAAVGIASIGGMLQEVSSSDDFGLLVKFAGTDSDTRKIVRAPIAPGLYQDVRIAADNCLPLNQTVVVSGPCVLALDGERERVLKPKQTARMRVLRDGPWVIDVNQCLQAGVAAGAFNRTHGDRNAH